MERKTWNKINYYAETFNLKDILSFSDDDILDNVRVIFADYETIVNNFDFFIRVLEILELKDNYAINVDSYETVKFINDHLKEKKNLTISILDDYEMKDRSNISKSQIDKVSFSLPLSYIMWGIDFDDFTYVSGVSYNKNAMCYNGNETIDIDTLKRIKDIINDLKSLGRFTDLQIIMLVSNYLQKNVEYIAENKEIGKDYIYSLDKPINHIEDEVGLIETVLFKKYGLCTGIANSTTVLLNNPTFRIDARTIFNQGHAFNIVRYNHKYYFLDNTWNITRSGNEFPKAVKVKEFNPKYILYGANTFEKLGDKSYLCDNPNISKVNEDGIRQSEIIRNKQMMMNRVSFTYEEDIVHPLSKIKKF